MAEGVPVVHMKVPCVTALNKNKSLFISASTVSHHRKITCPDRGEVYF